LTERPEKNLAARRPRVLIVEDEMMVAMLIEDLAEELGFEVLGSVGRLDDAIALTKEAAFDAAILDVNLNGEETYPLASILDRRKVPFVFATGYGREGVRDRFPDTPVLQKPFQREALGRALDAAIRSRQNR
jgi:CheY-like chemotaxis protein